MTLKEIADIIKSIGIPWRYDHFDVTPDPPYIVYYYPSENDIHADNGNYVNRRQLFIELYTDAKDFAKETAVETILKAGGLSWYKTTDFLSDEVIFQTTYETEVLING